MKLTHILIAVTCFSSFIGWQHSQVQLWTTGPLHASEVIGKTGEMWFGLFGDSLTLELRESRVTVTDSHTVGGLYDRFVTVDQPGSPLFLLRGLTGLSNRPVLTVLSIPTFIHPGESKGVKFDESMYYSFTAFGEAVDETVDVVINNYAIRLRQGRRSQVIASFDRIGSDKHPVILWAGDLDGDGKLDLLMDTATHYNLIESTLFLSSAAMSGNLVGQVASFKRGGC